MKVLQNTIGGTHIYIQAIDDDLDIIGKAQTGHATQPTGIEERLTDAYTRLKSVLRGIAEDISSEIIGINIANRPKELQMEFNYLPLKW